MNSWPPHNLGATQKLCFNPCGMTDLCFCRICRLLASRVLRPWGRLPRRGLIGQKAASDASRKTGEMVPPWTPHYPTLWKEISVRIGWRKANLRCVLTYLQYAVRYAEPLIKVVLSKAKMMRLVKYLQTPPSTNFYDYWNVLQHPYLHFSAIQRTMWLWGVSYEASCQKSMGCQIRIQWGGPKCSDKI